MKFNLKKVLVAAILVLGISAFNVNAAPDGWYTINMDGVPSAVIKAAQEAKPGIQLKKHRLIWRQDQGVYIVVGYSYGKKWKLNVTSSGQVLSVESMESD